jgi:mRNA interferase MazF
MEVVKVSRGDVWLCDLSFTIGSEQGGVRPCLIVQCFKGNMYSPTTQIVPLTTSTIKNKLPTHVYLDANEFKMERSSIALCEQLRTIDKNRLICKLTEINKEKMKEVNEALKISLELYEEEAENYARTAYRGVSNKVVAAV